MTVKCFLVKPVGRVRLYARRYRLSSKDACPGKMSYHDERVLIDTVPASVVDGVLKYDEPVLAEDDQRWPAACNCGRAFTADDERQIFAEEIYADEKGREYVLSDNIPGMMYDATWMHDHKAFCGPDGRSIHVVCPDGHAWCIDSRCRNCTLPNDNEHKCWVRHGEPPVITVNKKGKTCSAGGGSIDTGTYHGFLQDGKFT